MTELQKISENILFKQFLSDYQDKAYPYLIDNISDEIFNKKLTFNQSIEQISYYIGDYSDITSLAYHDLIAILYLKFYGEHIDSDSLSCYLASII